MRYICGSDKVVSYAVGWGRDAGSNQRMYDSARQMWPAESRRNGRGGTLTGTFACFTEKSVLAAVQVN